MSKPESQESGQGKIARPLMAREAFSKISEVEGIRLSDEAKRTFDDFDRRKLSADDRRRAIIGKFRREAAE